MQQNHSPFIAAPTAWAPASWVIAPSTAGEGHAVTTAQFRRIADAFRQETAGLLSPYQGADEDVCEAFARWMKDTLPMWA